MTAVRHPAKTERMTEQDEMEAMLARANAMPGVSDVLRVYASLDPAVAAYQAYTTSQTVPPASSSSTSIA